MTLGSLLCALSNDIRLVLKKIVHLIAYYDTVSKTIQASNLFDAFSFKKHRYLNCTIHDSINKNWIPINNTQRITL